jgi:salicylate hydroxylase
MSGRDDLPVIVVGGGIGGLTAAGCLHKMGLPVLVLEQAPELGEVGAGVQISPNGVHVLRYLGLGDEIDRLGCKPDFYNARDWKTARILYKAPRNPLFAEKYGCPYYQIHRADLLNALQKAVPRERIRLGTRVTAVTQSDDRVVVETASGERIEGRAALGADGIHSAVREALFGPDNPRWAGIVIFRLTVDTDRLDPETAKIGPGTYHGPHGHVTIYPISGGRKINFAGAFDTAQWQQESWSLECGKDEVRAAYPGWHRDLQALIDTTTRINKWALFDRDPLPQWTKGRVSLLGDAAHPMLPFYAQGACQAIEDGYVAAALLSRADGDVAGALAEYERIRQPRTARIQLGARARVVTMHEPSRIGRLWRNLNYWISGLIGAKGKRFDPDWIYAYNVVAEFPAREPAAA